MSKQKPVVAGQPPYTRKLKPSILPEFQKRPTVKALLKRITELGGRVAGLEQSYQLIQNEKNQVLADTQRMLQQKVATQELLEKARATCKTLEQKLERKRTDHLSDAELIGLAAEVQAELTTVPASPARRKLQAALEARGVTEPFKQQWERVYISATKLVDAHGTDDLHVKTMGVPEENLPPHYRADYKKP
jgi:hypothetical protein